MGTRLESRMREGVVGGRRTSVEIVFRGRASDSRSSRFSDRGATSPTAVGGGASSIASARFRIIDSRSRQTPAETRRLHVLLCQDVIEWISDRQFDIQEEITKGNAAEVARLSSLVVQAATSLQPVHTSMVGQFVLQCRDHAVMWRDHAVMWMMKHFDRGPFRT